MKTPLIKPQTVAEQVATILENRLLSGEYSYGQKLPPERKLAEELGVSRPSIRSALQTLVARNLLTSRQGDGYYVSNRLDEGWTEVWSGFIGRHDYLADEVLDFRRSIEGVAASLAARRRTQTDLERLRFWLTQIRHANGAGTVERQSQADVRFHQAIAEAAHNVLFVHLSKSLLTMLQNHTKHNLANMFGVANLQDELMQQHQDLYNAIEKQDPIAAEAAAHKHLDFVGNSLNNEQQEYRRRHHAEALAKSDYQFHQ